MLYGGPESDPNRHRHGDLALAVGAVVVIAALVALEFAWFYGPFSLWVGIPLAIAVGFCAAVGVLLTMRW